MTSTPTMLERAARAMWADRYPDTPWGAMGDSWSRDFVGHARAVLQAIREPDAGMIEAMYATVRHIVSRKMTAEVFQAAIDKVLEE